MRLDYAKSDEYYRRHHERYKRYVEAGGLTCQECCGRGEILDFVTDEGDESWVPCAWCEGTGFVDRWTRGFWLREKKLEKAFRLRDRAKQTIGQILLERARR